jgi:hypothetical protein
MTGHRRVTDRLEWIASSHFNQSCAFDGKNKKHEQFHCYAYFVTGVNSGHALLCSGRKLDLPAIEALVYDGNTRITQFYSIDGVPCIEPLAISFLELV